MAALAAVMTLAAAGGAWAGRMQANRCGRPNLPVLQSGVPAGGVQPDGPLTRWGVETDGDGLVLFNDGRTGCAAKAQLVFIETCSKRAVALGAAPLTPNSRRWVLEDAEGYPEGIKRVRTRTRAACGAQYLGVRRACTTRPTLGLFSGADAGAVLLWGVTPTVGTVCPSSSWTYLAASLGGFCCGGTLVNGGRSCSSAICAVTRYAARKGFPPCPTCNSASPWLCGDRAKLCHSSYVDVTWNYYGDTPTSAAPTGRAFCPTSGGGTPWTFYAGSAGGFCCRGRVSNGVLNCMGTACAVDRNPAPQGVRRCSTCDAHRFDSPTVDGIFSEHANNDKIYYVIDYCRCLGTDCGAPTASDWCVLQGFASLLSFSTGTVVANGLYQSRCSYWAYGNPLYCMEPFLTPISGSASVCLRAARRWRTTVDPVLRAEGVRREAICDPNKQGCTYFTHISCSRC
ncbi:hypothetical protein C2E20_8254 isoform A [Micractinium conductrix]|uniref:Uncharacterized protein n=1 Tax=Micractinium conductrix TaxID=554055 RepID=A0A2P6V1Z2_9CHLO|nr:hypothetical protein C2E20_8254 isoform A [Micractinium conductrix]|eukprot:PSC68102.1 hypothetical protein C2E20_8254 isoform A [Micractinium conductrix]